MNKPAYTATISTLVKGEDVVINVLATGDKSEVFSAYNNCLAHADRDGIAYDITPHLLNDGSLFVSVRDEQGNVVVYVHMDNTSEPAARIEAEETTSPAAQPEQLTLDSATEPVTNPAATAQRVQMHPATDAWMMGDRYGVITKYGRNGAAHIKLDKSGRTVRVSANNYELL